MINDENKDKYKRIFSERLKSLRNRDNLSQQELGQKIGLSRSEILRWENKHRLPSFKSLEQLANIFKVPIAIFFISYELSELENIINNFHLLENTKKD